MKKRIIYISLLSLFLITFLSVTCFAAEGDPVPDSPQPYQGLYDLINTYIFGGTVVAGSYQDLVCILVATIGCLFFVAMPFMAVFWLVSRFR